MKEDLQVRELRADDFGKGYVQLLSKLASVGDISEDMFKERFQQLRERAGEYFILVIEDTAKATLVGAGTLLVEFKFIHACSKVGHIEDVVVLPETRGKGLGLLVVNTLVEEAKKRGCYKVILDCDEKNIDFYKKAGMERKEVQMVKYF